MKDIFTMYPTESKLEFEYRIVSNKNKYDLTWDMVADIINTTTGQVYSADTYRKRQSNMYYEYYLENTDRINEVKEDAIIERDLKTNERKNIRLNARIRNMQEMALKHAELYYKYHTVPEIKPIESESEKKAILCLSDWHYGIGVENYYNTYNLEVAEARIAEVFVETIQQVQEQHITEMVVLNMGDLISGRIHKRLELENIIQPKDQTIQVSYILAEYLMELSKYVKIRYYSTIDNHSRIEPNKKDALDSESFNEFITEFISILTKDNPNIEVIKENVYNDIIAFDIGNYKVAAVHGHKDKPKTIISKIKDYLDFHIDLVLAGHLHHFSADEDNGTVFVANGSLMGTDAYAQGLRLHSIPSQNLIIVNDERCVYDIHRITVE